MLNRLRQRRRISRQNRVIDRAMHAAPTDSMRDEIAVRTAPGGLTRCRASAPLPRFSTACRALAPPAAATP